MIIEGLFNLIFGLFGGLIDMLPTVAGSIPTAFIGTLETVVQSSAYFIPITALLPLLAISIGLDSFNLVWKLLLRIKSFIPAMGG